jgi:hypothetical protein
MRRQVDEIEGRISNFKGFNFSLLLDRNNTGYPVLRSLAIPPSCDKPLRRITG